MFGIASVKRVVWFSTGEWREGYAAYIQLITFVDNVLTCQRQSINSVIELISLALTSNDVTIKKEKKTSFYRKRSKL